MSSTTQHWAHRPHYSTAARDHTQCAIHAGHVGLRGTYDHWVARACPNGQQPIASRTPSPNKTKKKQSISTHTHTHTHTHTATRRVGSRMCIGCVYVGADGLRVRECATTWLRPCKPKKQRKKKDKISAKLLPKKKTTRRHDGRAARQRVLVGRAGGRGRKLQARSSSY